MREKIDRCVSIMDGLQTSVDEPLRETLIDIAGYAILGMIFCDKPVEFFDEVTLKPKTERTEIATMNRMISFIEQALSSSKQRQDVRFLSLMEYASNYFGLDVNKLRKYIEKEVKDLELDMVLQKEEQN